MSKQAIAFTNRGELSICYELMCVSPQLQKLKYIRNPQPGERRFPSLCDMKNTLTTGFPTHKIAFFSVPL